MVVTLGQQYNVGEKPTVMLYTYINRHAGVKTAKTKTMCTSSNMVVIICFYIGCKDKIKSAGRPGSSEVPCNL